MADPYAEFGGSTVADPYAAFGGSTVTPAAAPATEAPRMTGITSAIDKIRNYLATGSSTTPYNKAQVGVPLNIPDTALGNAFQTPARGYAQAAQGVQQLGQEGQRVRGASNVLRGVGKMGAAFLPEAAVAAPLTTGLALAAGTGASGAASSVAGALGAPQDIQDLIGDVAGIAAGGLAAGRAGALKDAFSDVLPGKVEPTRATVQALKPPNRDLKFSSAVPTALSEINQSAIDTGTPVKGNGDFGVDDFLNLAAHAKDRLWSQYQQYLGPKADWKLDLSPAADAADAMITKKMELEDPDKAAALRAQNNVYRNQFSVQDTERLLRDTNAGLDSYYAKLPRGQYSALKTNPDTAADYARAEQIRQILYGGLDEESNGAVPKDLMQRYGAVSKIQQAAQSRKNVAERQQPDNLTDQYSKAVSALMLAKGAWNALVTHDYAGAGLDVAEAAALRGAAKWVKGQNTTDSLLRRALESHPDLPAPFTPPPQPNVRGLLGSAPLITPPPADTSGPIPPTVPRGFNVTNPGIQPNRQLGAPPLVTPAPADTSGPTGAQPYMGRGMAPQTGRRTLGPASPSPIKQPGFGVQDMVAVRDPMTGRVTYVSRQDLRDLANLPSPEAQ